mmetsp:Transcript_26372/g.84557  ORF Transcript_26372/g.84557 Transcript_26372/m.84557 type:complete len:300 (+) Transcript_26372:108-1007(+)
MHMPSTHRSLASSALNADRQPRRQCRQPRCSRVDGCMHGAHEDGRRHKPSLLLLFSTERVQRRALALRHLRRRCALSRRRPPRGGRCARSGEQLPDRACVCGRQHPLREGRRLTCLCLCSRDGQQAARRRNPPLELVALGQLARRQADAVRLERRRVVAAENVHLCRGDRVEERPQERPEGSHQVRGAHDVQALEAVRVVCRGHFGEGLEECDVAPVEVVPSDPARVNHRYKLGDAPPTPPAGGAEEVAYALLGAHLLPHKLFGAHRRQRHKNGLPVSAWPLEDHGSPFAVVADAARGH